MPPADSHRDSCSHTKVVLEFGGLKAPWYNLSGEKRICRQCPAPGRKGPRREPAPSRSIPGLSGALSTLLVQSHQPDHPTLVLPLSTQAASEDLVPRSQPATPACPRKRLKSLSGSRCRGAHPDSQDKRRSRCPGPGSRSARARLRRQGRAQGGGPRSETSVFIACTVQMGGMGKASGEDRELSDK